MSHKHHRAGFTLIEVLIYIVIFTISATFLTAILTTITNVQNRQGSTNEVNNQLAFVNNAVQNVVQQSSLIDVTPGVATSTLKLRMASSSLDPALIYASGTVLYLTEGSSTMPLTDSNVAVNNFTATKFENPGGFSVVQINLSLSYSGPGATVSFTRVLQSAIARISAATFDSAVTPNADNSLDLGTASTKWRNGYFSGSLDVYGNVGVGTAHSASADIKSAGDIGVSNSASGLILTSPGGVCFRITVTNVGALATSSAACP